MPLIYFSIVFLFCVHAVTPHIYLFDIHHDYHERNAEFDHNFHLKLFPTSTPAPSTNIVSKLKRFYQNEKLTAAKPRKNKCERNFGSIYGTKTQKIICIEKMRGEKSVERGREIKKKVIKHDLPHKQKIKMISWDYVDINALNRQDFDDSFSEDYLDINDLLRAKTQIARPADYFELFLEKLSFGGPKQPTKCNSNTKKTRKFNIKNRKTRFERLKKTKNKLSRNPKRFEVVRDINDSKLPKIWIKYKDYFDSEATKKPKKNNDFFDSEETKKPKENNVFFDSGETNKPKKYKDYSDSEETGKPKKSKKYNDFFDSEETKKPKKPKKNSDSFDSEETQKPKKYKDYYDSEAVKKPKNLERFTKVHNPGVKKQKLKKYTNHGSKVTKKPKQSIKYNENYESEESDDTKNSQSKEFYIQGNNLIEADEDGRRRLPSFLPKRYHWKPEEIHELGYYWFNGPRGQFPDPVPLKR